MILKKSKNRTKASRNKNATKDKNPHRDSQKQNTWRNLFPFTERKKKKINGKTEQNLNDADKSFLFIHNADKATEYVRYIFFYLPSPSNHALKSSTDSFAITTNILTISGNTSFIVLSNIGFCKPIAN